MKYENEKHILEISHDPDCESPRTRCENLGTFYTWGHNFSSPDEHSFIYPGTFLEILAEELGCEYVDEKQDNELLQFIATKALILLVYRHVHGGVTYSTEPFSNKWDSWDSRCVGWIYVTHNDILKADISFERAEEVLKAEVETYSNWASGDCYGFTLYEKEECPCCGNVKLTEVDSCHGFIGPDPKMNGMWGYLPDGIKEAIDQCAK